MGYGPHDDGREFVRVRVRGEGFGGNTQHMRKAWVGLGGSQESVRSLFICVYVYIIGCEHARALFIHILCRLHIYISDICICGMLRDGQRRHACGCLCALIEYQR